MLYEPTARLPPSASRPPATSVAVNPSTMIIRMSGENAELSAMADRLLATLDRPVVLGGQEIFVTTSIGVAIYPDDGTEGSK